MRNVSTRVFSQPHACKHQKRSLGGQNRLTLGIVQRIEIDGHVYRRSLRTSRTTWREACAATCENRRAAKGRRRASAPPSGAKEHCTPRVAASCAARLTRSICGSRRETARNATGSRSERAAAQSSNARPRIVRALSRRHSRLPPEKAHVTFSGPPWKREPCSRAKATVSRMAVKPVRLQQRGPPRSASFPRTRRERWH